MENEGKSLNIGENGGKWRSDRKKVGKKEQKMKENGRKNGGKSQGK